MPKKTIKPTNSKAKSDLADPEAQKLEPQDELKAEQSPYHILITEAPSDNARWYIVHTYSGHEVKVAHTLTQRVKTMHLENKVFELLVPTQEKIRIQKGKKETIKEKIFPGYLLVKMTVDDDSWLAVRTTQGITGFVGMSNKPTPLPESEVQTIMKFMSQAAPKFKSTYIIGDSVKIIDGPFNDFIGAVDSVDEGKGKLRVLVSIFGRETPVELDFLQVAKI